MMRDQLWRILRIDRTWCVVAFGLSLVLLLNACGKAGTAVPTPTGAPTEPVLATIHPDEGVFEPTVTPKEWQPRRLRARALTHRRRPAHPIRAPCRRRLRPAIQARSLSKVRPPIRALFRPMITIHTRWAQPRRAEIHTRADKSLSGRHCQSGCKTVNHPDRRQPACRAGAHYRAPADRHPGEHAHAAPDA